MQLDHNFKLRCHDIDSLLVGCNKIVTFCTRLTKQAQWHPDRYDPDKYKGDGFELFVEALIKLSPVDNRIGIGNYQIVTETDIGVDGYGIGVDIKPATVQAKYRGKNDVVLTANSDHLSNFVQASLRAKKFGGFGVDPETETNMLIITTADNLHYFTDYEMYGGQVRCLGYKQLRELTDNNLLFWNAFRELCIG